MNQSTRIGVRLALVILSIALLAGACDNPVGGEGKTTTGTVTLEKYNQITTADSDGKGGMSTAQIVEVMGFDGERSESVVFGTLFITHTFRESPTKYLAVNFSKDDRATSKSLYGITFLTLEKYQAIEVDATAGGTTLDQVNTSFGINGTAGTTNSGLTNYEWLQSTNRFQNTVLVTFRDADKKAVGKLLIGGLPGMLTKAKYDQIQVGASGSTPAQINTIMGFLPDRHTQGRTKQRWSESPDKYVEVVFNAGTGRATSATPVGIADATAK